MTTLPHVTVTNSTSVQYNSTVHQYYSTSVPIMHNTYHALLHCTCLQNIIYEVCLQIQNVVVWCVCVSMCVSVCLLLCCFAGISLSATCQLCYGKFVNMKNLSMRVISNELLCCCVVILIFSSVIVPCFACY